MGQKLSKGGLAKVNLAKVTKNSINNDKHNWIEMNEIYETELTCDICPAPISLTKFRIDQWSKVYLNENIEWYTDVQQQMVLLIEEIRKISDNLISVHDF